MKHTHTHTGPAHGPATFNVRGVSRDFRLALALYLHFGAQAMAQAAARDPTSGSAHTRHTAHRPPAPRSATPLTSEQRVAFCSEFACCTFIHILYIYVYFIVYSYAPRTIYMNIISMDIILQPGPERGARRNILPPPLPPL